MGGVPVSAGVSRNDRRIQAAIDSGAALVLAVLAYPFPVMRAMLPLPVFVISILVVWQLVQVSYCALAAAVWGSTGGMYLRGLSLRTTDGGEATRGQRATWGALAGIAALVHVAAPPSEGKPALAERASGLVLSAD
jgi:hypothetical protein